jgi:hypothetical protein
MSPRIRKRLLIVTVTPLALAVAMELFLRTRVPSCGVTPFRISQRSGLASEFRPGFKTLYKGFEVSFNAEGYRGPEFPARAEGALRVALVGDSFVFGSAVGLADTLAARLEEALGDGQVLNMGVPGYGAGNVAAVVEHDALRLEPDVVLYVFYNNDIDPPPAFQEIPQDAIIDGMHGFPLHSALLQWLNVRVKQTALRWFGLQLARRTPAQSLALWEQGGGERVREAITRMRDLCAAQGVRFLVAGYPNLTMVGKNPFLPIDLGTAEVCKELGVEWVDLAEAFDGERDLTRYWASVFDTHPSGAANEKVAACLAPRLRGE